jgi:hypothetical protein
MTDTVENTAVDTATTEAGSAQPQTMMSLQDLIDIQNLIAVVTQRGAFKADEMSAAGTLYDRLTAFIKTMMPPEEPAEEGGSSEAQNAPEGTYQFQGE